MILVNIYEAKAKLSEYVEAAANGERVLICRHNRPVAELRPVEAGRTAPRDLTPMYPGSTFTPPAFFAPLTAGEIAAWEGRTGMPETKVAEAPAPYAHATRRRRQPRARR